MGTVLVQHDPGCKWARLGAEAEINEHGRITGVRNPGAGHSDAAKRFSDTVNLHLAAGTRRGWLALKYADGTGGRDVYATRAEAVEACWPWEDSYFYVTLSGGRHMSVCAAEELVRFKRIMSEIERPDRDFAGGGLEVIPRLAVEDAEAQIEAVRTGRGYVAMGHKKERA